MLTSMTVRGTLIALACAISMSAHAMADTPKRVEIPAGDLRPALLQLSKAFGIELLYEPGQLKDAKTHGVKGIYTPEAAVRILLKGTPFELRTDRSGAMLIAPAHANATSDDSSTPGSGDPKEGKKQSSDGFLLAQATPGQAAENTSVENGEQSEAEKKHEELPEVVVTGTHIRGVTTSASAVQVYTRDDIDQSGAGTIQQFIQNLPQNFNGGASETTNVSGYGDAYNYTNATGMNLRGLGNDATLVLVNGRRVAPGNTYGNFVDVSMIPLSAVDRIEIVTDGASAIYGSDAVGGVVNFILRSNYEGSETRARYGAVDEGNKHDIEVGQTVGHDWGMGSALLNYDYVDSTPLSASDRSYTLSASQPTSLLPEQTRQSMFATANQTLAEGVELFGEGTYAHRETQNFYSQDISTIQEEQGAGVDAYSGTIGTRAEVSSKDELEVSATYASSRTRAVLSVLGSVPPIGDVKVTSDLLSIDGKLDGVAGATWAGPIKFAVGGQYRDESFDSKDVLDMIDFNPTRRIIAGFLELRIPIVGAATSGSSGEDRLSLSLSGRSEHYSDFGPANNPQIGLIWKALSSLLVRGTYGTSFTAPLLHDLNPLPVTLLALPLPNSTGGTTNTLYIDGGNPNLTAQKATTWTLGLNFQPQPVPGLKSSISYYNIVFNDRITDPSSQISNIFDALQLAPLLGPSIIQFNPSPAVVQAWAATPGFQNPLGINLATIGAIFDSRVHNLSRVTTNGIDLSVSYTTAISSLKLESGVDATYIFRFADRFTSTSPVDDVVSTPYNPINLRARARTALTQGPVTGAVFLNYTNHYSADNEGVIVPVASWTTVDVTATYRFLGTIQPFRGASVIVGGTNIGNRPPPYVFNPVIGGNGVNYDGANASPLGRYWFAQLTKRF